MKIISIIGARPQFIKAGLVSKRLREKRVKEIILHTGQHYDFNMSEVFFRELNIPKPDYYLGIGSGTHGEQTGRMLIEVEKALLKENPDLAIVYGDANSTLAGALAASKLHIPLAHVEAGLRSFNKNMPEELNRILTDHISDILFTPTDISVENLRAEGITKGVHKVGDVMFDAALETSKVVEDKKILKKYDLSQKDFILVTIHRAENTDNYKNMKEILDAISEIAKSGIKVFFPLHPRTKRVINEYGIKMGSGNLTLSEPVSYMEMIALEKNAKVIVTDSGGVQKEGYFFKTPCIIPRNETEWVELVQSGFNVLTGADKQMIIDAVTEECDGNGTISGWTDLYGGGMASERIAEELIG